jgi:RNA polymerase sigma-70 factor, ECF subfamily
MPTPPSIPDPRPDDSLMRAIAADDEAALAELISRHREKLANYFRRSGVTSEYEDLVQEVFVKAWNARQRWQPTAKVTTWLYTLARNALIDRVRRGNRLRVLHDEVRAESPAETPASDPAVADADAALAALTEDFRGAVVLVVCQGLKYREAAEVLGVPEGTVKSRVHEGLQRLRQWFDPHETNPT